MRFRLALLALSIAAALPLGSAAQACIFLALPRSGLPPTERELAAEQASNDRALRLQRRERASAALAGGMEPAARLADMLVPNIRPIHIDRSDCGPMNEIDLGPGEETPDDVLSGTRLAGHAASLDLVWRIDAGDTFGPMCNAEFRSRFAAFLRRRLSAPILRDSYLFLGSYWDPPGSPAELRRRLTAFANGTRRPPLRWSGANRRQEQEIRRWMRLVPTGRIFKQAMDDFWRENEPLLADTAAACPQAVARWPAEQARLVDMLEGQFRRR